ncbi:hypothetical protein VaNZ11_003730, partial [Volvox africanus]
AGATAAAADRALYERQAGGFAGKGAVRMALHCLIHLTALLPPQDWASLWQQLSGSFWVSRLLRDRDSVLRALAAEVLARLLQPGATVTQAMVAQGWPDAVKMMSKVATDHASCYALRTASLRVLACCMAQDAVAPNTGAQAEHVEEATTSLEPSSGLPRRQLFTSFSALPSATVLMQNEALWAALPRMLREPAAPAPFQSAALTLLLQFALLDGERTATFLQHPGLLERLLQLLDARLLLDGGGSGGAASPTPRKVAAGAAGGSDRAALLLVVLGQVEVLAGADHHVGGSGCGSSGGLDVRLVEGDAAAGQAAAAAATVQAAALSWAGFETDVQLEGCVGLEAVVMSHEEWATCAAGVATPQGMPRAPANCDPARRRQHLHALHCSALVAQLLAHTLQDPPLLHLPALGRSPAEVAAILLGSFARAAGGVAAWDEARRALPPPRLLEGAARLEAVQHTAAAANAALQLLDAEGLHGAVVALDGELKRSSAPLLTRCAEVLRADCSPRPLRLVVVCLVATLLSRRETAFRLLRFEIDDSSANEHLVGSTGREVGMELCAALLELLPDDALLSGGGGAASAAAAFTAGNPNENLSGGSRARSSVPSAHGSSVAAVTGAGPGQAATAAAEGLRGSLQFRPSNAVASQDLRSDSLCVIVALRNLLSYSCSAKTMALRAGYHRLLLHGCARMAAVLTAAGPIPAGVGPGERSSAIAAIGPGRVGTRRGAVAPARGQGLQRKPGSGPATRPPGLWQDAETAASSASIPYPPEPTLEPRSPIPAVSPVARSSGTAIARQDADNSSKSATRRVAEQKLVASLSLLRHLAYGSAVARQVLVQDGLVAMLRSLWPVAAAASTSGPLFHELLSCLTNILPECSQARIRVAQEAGSGSSAIGGRSGGGGGGPEATGVGAPGTLLGNLLALLFGGARIESATSSLAVGALLQISAAEDGTQLLLKSPLLGLCQKVLQDLSSGGGGGGGAGLAGVARVGRDVPRQLALLELLANLAAWPEGQRALLRSSSGPGLLDLVVRLIGPGPEGLLGLPAHGSPAINAANPPANARHQQQLMQLRNAALALVRNLCFAPEAKAHLLAHPGVLPSLVAAVEAVADNPQGAAFAASGMHALAYHGEKVKAALRRVPSAHQRLIAAYASCRFAEDRAKAQQGPRAVTEHFQPHEIARAGLRRMPLEAGNKPQNWIHSANSELCGLLIILQATSTENSHLNVLPPDRSPQRDQYA